MKYLTSNGRQALAGAYTSPPGFYDYVKSLPFLGQVTSDVKTLVAGQWTEIKLVYEIGGSGLADGAWIKGTFKFYSDWALFQTSDRTKDNYVSAEVELREPFVGQESSTVQSLGVRFDQKGHERPFQKAVIIDIVDGYLNPGDKITIRLGDRRFGSRGTRVQTFVERDFRWRFYIDTVGTSRFAPIRPDLSWNIVAGAPHRLELISPRVVQPGAKWSLVVHAEDIWGNVTRDLQGLIIQAKILSAEDSAVWQDEIALSTQGWSTLKFESITLHAAGSYTLQAELVEVSTGKVVLSRQTLFSVVQDLTVPRVLFGDLHVHSDDTVGTEDSTYNFTYGRDVAGLDVLGYTANDFQITKERWDATVELIKYMNDPGSFVIFPGTEWCGNSAVGGDHNVIFLDDPATSPSEFPYDRNGNVARSFEWSEDGPKDLVPGAWPVDEVYAIYAHNAEKVLMIPHVGGRRCNLSWHHPGLEKLVEIGSAWGHFEWLLHDAVKRGYRLGVSANSDEHRGRCGGGVPGTAVFGTRGGLTGILTPVLDRQTVATALRARHTFATTGPRLVALVTTAAGHQQGDDIEAPSDSGVELKYHLFGQEGFCSVEAFDASGCIFERDLWREAEKAPTVVRVAWGGARLYDRYKEAVWTGSIDFSEDTRIVDFVPFGGFSYNPEDQVIKTHGNTIAFSSRTSGDTDGVHVQFEAGRIPNFATTSGTLGGYVKVGDPLAGHPHRPKPTFNLAATRDELFAPGGKRVSIPGGAELFLAVEAVPDTKLPTEVAGSLHIGGKPGEDKTVYFVGREWSGHKVVSSPVFIKYI